MFNTSSCSAVYARMRFRTHGDGSWQQAAELIEDNAV